MIAVVINGERKAIAENESLGSLCARLNLPDRGVAVAVNYELVPRPRLGEVILRENDVVEIVTASAGG